MFRERERVSRERERVSRERERVSRESTPSGKQVVCPGGI